MVPNHRPSSESHRKGASTPPVSALGPWWHQGRRTLGPLYYRWGFLEGKFEHSMNLEAVSKNSVQPAVITVCICSVQGIVEVLGGNWR